MFHELDYRMNSDNKLIDLNKVLEKDKQAFFSEEFYKKISSKIKLQEYQTILKKSNFKYPVYNPYGKRGFGDLQLNKTISEWLAQNLNQFLRVTTPKELNDKYAISRNQLTSTFCAYVNTEANNNQTYESHFMKFWETRPLFDRCYFNNNLDSLIKQHTVQELDNKSKKYFQESEHKLQEKIYTKLDLVKESPKKKQEQPKRRYQTTTKHQSIIDFIPDEEIINFQL